MDHSPSTDSLLTQLEAISADRPDRVLRLRGVLQPLEVEAADSQLGGLEPFELLLFRGFASSTTHPTAFDPDHPVMPPGAVIQQVELLQAPLRPDADRVLLSSDELSLFLDPQSWA